MKTPNFVLAAVVACLAVSAQASMPLTESIFTEIIREANVVNAAKDVTPARPNTVFKVPERVRTGMASRIELTAPDQTITRVGASTVFTFEAGQRSILLEKGSVLFHSPAGAGGGKVQYHGTAAAVLGTTMMCAVLPDGSFKILNLEGKVTVTLKNGQSLELSAGQMVIVPPDGETFQDIEFFNLGKLVPRLALVVGFSRPLSSLALIEAAIKAQNQEIADGKIKLLASTDAADFGLDTISTFPPEGFDHTQIYVSPTQGAN